MSFCIVKIPKAQLQLFWPLLNNKTFNLFPNKPWFLLVCSTSLLKTQWEKEKLLVTSNFSFSHSAFHLLENLLSYSSNLKLSSAKSLSLEESKICRLYLPNATAFADGKLLVVKTDGICL